MEAVDKVRANGKLRSRASFLVLFGLPAEYDAIISILILKVLKVQMEVQSADMR